MPGTRRQNGQGALRKLPSGRWQARFHGTDGVMRPASVTFDTKLDAGVWLKSIERQVAAGSWDPPAPSLRASATQTLGLYSRGWLEIRELKPRTRALYRELLETLILPGLGDVALDRLTPTTVRNWHAGLNPKTPTRRAQAYSLLRAIYTTAVADELVATNPCRIRGAGRAKTRHKATVATLSELEAIVAALPPRYRAMVLLAAWCGLRFGELAELRQGDVDLERGYLHVRRGVTRAEGQVFVGDPKSEAGRRSVSVPPHLLPVLAAHLAEHTQGVGDQLLFPAKHGGHLNPSSLYAVWYPARAAAGRPDLRFHDLRHTGATLAAATGATLADLMARLGHSTPGAALRYQHAAAERDQAIAAALSGFAEGRTVPLLLAR